MPGVEGRVLQKIVVGDAGVVNEYVHVAEVFFRRVKEIVHVFFFAYVGLYGDGIGIGFAKFFEECVGGFFTAEIVNDEFVLRI